MKFSGLITALIFVSGVAQANLVTGLLNAAIENRSDQQGQSEPSTLGDAFRAGGDHAMARYYANQLLNAGAMLSVIAMASNGGQGQDMTYAESGLNNYLPCKADFYSTKEGIVTLILGDTCPPKDNREEGFSVTVPDVINALYKEADGKIVCEKNICQIDYVRK